MKFSNSAVVLVTLAAGQAMAATMARHAFPKHNHAARHVESMTAEQEKRDTDDLTSRQLNPALLQSKFAANVMAPASHPSVWIGAQGPYTNTFHNAGGEDLILVVWGPAGSWVNAVPPYITAHIPAYSNQTLSFANGASGAWAPIFQATQFVNGQISDTWGEYTFANPYSVVDVSREVQLNGRNMAIVGPTCTSDMTKCMFQCAGGVATCTTGYQLVNCATGSQEGANFGTYDGADSGGCGGMGAAANLNTYLNGAASY